MMSALNASERRGGTRVRPTHNKSPPSHPEMIPLREYKNLSVQYLPILTFMCIYRPGRMARIPILVFDRSCLTTTVDYNKPLTSANSNCKTKPLHYCIFTCKTTFGLRTKFGYQENYFYRQMDKKKRKRIKLKQKRKKKNKLLFSSV